MPPSVCQEECSVLDLLVFNKDFSIFVSMLKLADLIDLLSTEGPLTVFAPTNDAFDGLPTALFKVTELNSLVNLYLKTVLYTNDISSL